MRKITFLMAVLFATMFINAEVITVENFSTVPLAETETDCNVSVQGITMAFHGTILDATYNEETWRTLRVYAGQTVTISYASTISKIEVIGMAKKGANITASTGTVSGGDYSAATADTYKYENGFTEPLFVVTDIKSNTVTLTPIKQIRLYGIRVTTDATAVNNTKADNMSMFVANRTLMVEGIADGTMIEIYSATGARIMMQELVNGQVQLDNLSKGVYVVRAGNEKCKIVL
jgi:hypothetical protein